MQEQEQPPIIMEGNVVITLDENLSKISTKTHKLLSSKLKNLLPQEIPFSYQFNLKKVIKLSQELIIPRENGEFNDNPEMEEDSNTFFMRMPNCITISHQFKCLLIGVEDEVLFLDYHTKKCIKRRVFPGSISDMAIEKDGHKGGEALIISYAGHFIEKYDLESLFKNSLMTAVLWRSGTRKERDQDSGRGFTDEFNYNWPEHLVICYSDKYDSFFGEDPKERHGNILFVCDKWNNRIKVLRSSDGKHLGMFGTKGRRGREPGSIIELSEPWGIELDNQDRILISEFSGHSIKRIDIQNGQMVLEKSFGGTSVMYNPNGIFYDRHTNRLIIADSGDCKITILDMENGQFMDPIHNESFKCVSDACINYVTGELYITDLYSEKLFIFE